MRLRPGELCDAIYSFKDYVAESETVRGLIEARRPGARTLLDVACGTGKHLEHLRENFEVQGLDLSADQLEVARERLPGVPLHEGDVADFDLGRRFDAVTCLFSAIGSVRTLERMRAAVAAMAMHLEPGGVVILEPWVKPEDWREDTLHALWVDEPELKIARVNTSERVGDLAVMDMHHLVGTPEGVEHFVERLELSLFTHEQYLDAFSAAGLEVEHDPEGLIGRGLYIGVRPA